MIEQTRSGDIEHGVAYHKNHPAIYVARALAQEGLAVRVRPSSKSVFEEEVILSPESSDTFLAVMENPKIGTLVQLQQRGSSPDLSQFDPDTQSQLHAYHQQFIQGKCDKAAKVAQATGRGRDAKTYATARDIAFTRRNRILRGLPELDIPAFIGRAVKEELERMRQETTTKQVS